MQEKSILDLNVFVSWLQLAKQVAEKDNKRKRILLKAFRLIDSNVSLELRLPQFVCICSLLLILVIMEWLPS